MKTKNYFWGLVLLFVAPGIHAETVTKTFKANQIKNLKLENGSGNSIIEGKDVEEAKIEAQKMKWHSNCTLEITNAGDSINASVSQKKSGSFFSNNECRVNFHIILPTHVSLLIDNGSGDTKIHDVTGNIGANVGSGNLVMERVVFEGLKAQAGSGNLKIDGIINKAEIKIGSGDIDLIYRQSPLSGGITIKAGSGNATIQMPENSKIKVDFQAGSGRLTSELDQLQSAPYSIFMTTGSGNLRIKKL